MIDDLLRSVLDNALDAIVSVAAAGQIESINKTGLKMFGYTGSDLIGKPITTLVPDTISPSEYAGLPWYLKSVNGRSIGIDKQTTGHRKDGSGIALELALSEFELNDSRHYTGILRDLTERNTLEVQLVQSQKMEAFGQRAGGVAHDF
ncbi:MAG: PAS domain S-box protein [Gemmatimonadaceae bacterium]